jgi:hypothetical protein
MVGREVETIREVARNTLHAASREFLIKASIDQVELIALMQAQGSIMLFHN